MSNTDLMYRRLINKMVVRLYGGPASITFFKANGEYLVAKAGGCVLCRGSLQQCFYSVRGWYEAAQLILKRGVMI